MATQVGRNEKKEESDDDGNQRKKKRVEADKAIDHEEGPCMRRRSPGKKSN